MKKCLAIAALLLASSSPRRPSTRSSMAAAPSPSIPIAAPFKFPASTTIPARRPNARAARKAIRDRPRRKTPQQAKTVPQAAPEAAPAGRAPARAGRRSGGARAGRTCPPLRPPLRGRRAVDFDRRRRPAATARQHRPPLRQPRRAAASAPVAAPAPPPPQQKRPPPRQPRHFAAANSPLGVWLTEEKEGKVRIEAVRRQSLRLFRRQEVEPERRAGSDQHEARQGQMERPDPRSEFRQHL